MNICALSGRLAKGPTLLSDGRTIKFLLTTHFVYRREMVREGTATVPCVLFDATKEQKDILLNKNYDKLRLELVGRVARSSCEGSDGVRTYNTDVVVDTGGMIIRRVR